MITRLGAAARTAAVWAALLAVVGPLVWVVRIALKSPDDYARDPSGFAGPVTLANFGDAWGAGLGLAMRNSAVVVLLGAVIATALATFAGYALAKLDFPGRRAVLVGIAAALGIPLAALAIPLFDQGLRYGIVGSLPGLAVVYGTIFSAWGTLLMRSYFQGVPDDLVEAASVDGATTWQVFARVALPLARPAVATVALINVFLQWSELILGLVLLPGAQSQTATVAVAQLATQFRTGGPLTAAGMLIVAAPVLALFLFGQRSIRGDVLAGAVKS